MTAHFTRPLLSQLERRTRSGSLSWDYFAVETEDGVKSLYTFDRIPSSTETTSQRVGFVHRKYSNGVAHEMFLWQLTHTGKIYRGLDMDFHGTVSADERGLSRLWKLIVTQALQDVAPLKAFNPANALQFYALGVHDPDRLKRSVAFLENLLQELQDA